MVNMSAFRFTAFALLVLSACCWAEDGAENVVEDENSAELPVSELLEKANSNLNPDFEGDIAINNKAERNADPCTSRDCMWGKWTDGLVYIPVYFSNDFYYTQKNIIIRAMLLFHKVSCIRFAYWQGQPDYLNIVAGNGCGSSIGRQGGGQLLSLNIKGCLHKGIIQHELLHALGFNHEQTRFDRDRHIKVIWRNIIEDRKINFNKIDTLNQGTPYDYNSVMHYHKTAFSKNTIPTMEAIPDGDVEFGKAKEMSRNDILRVNRLYKCHG